MVQLAAIGAIVRKHFDTELMLFIKVPNVFEGDITAEEEVLDWLIEMKVT